MAAQIRTRQSLHVKGIFVIHYTTYAIDVHLGTYSAVGNATNLFVDAIVSCF